MNPPAISVYMAIFQIWNHNRFKSPIYATRDELMYASKISSTATYHKCIKLLVQKEYIEYTPSYSSYTRTSIIIHALDNYTKSNAKQVQKLNPTHSKSKKDTEQGNEQPTKQLLEQGREQPREPLYNIDNNKHIKTIYKHNKTANNKLFDSAHEQKNEREKISIEKNIEKKDAPGGADDKNTIPPVWDRVFEFFISKSSSRIEAEKFFNHYSSNGWKVGGKTKMKDWHASARNWILNTNNYKPKNNSHPERVEGPKPNHLHTNQDKNYAEPL